MKTIKKGSKGDDVKYLQACLVGFGYSLSIDGDFGPTTDRIVKLFQSENGLGSDGIVGPSTWKLIESSLRSEMDHVSNPDKSMKLKESDYIRAAKDLNIPVAAIKAVQEVETGGKGGFIDLYRPTILFEGHIFWNQLKRHGKRPEDFVNGNEDILYPKWTKSHYIGGTGEYVRLERAKRINEDAALCSASWGMFQIMGFNYIACGCSSVQEFIDQMKESEGKQLDLFVKFIKFNGWDTYLKKLDWPGFACKYNGPSYKDNDYDIKLEKAYKKYLG